jgi:hypothetical protein
MRREDVSFPWISEHFGHHLLRGLDRVVYRCHCDGDLIGLSSRLFRKVSLSLTTCPKVSICASVSEYLSHVDCEEVAIEGVHVRA